MRRSDEEFKSELMLRVKKYRRRQQQRQKAMWTAVTAVACVIIAVTATRSGLYGPDTQTTEKQKTEAFEADRTEAAAERVEVVEETSGIITDSGEGLVAVSVRIEAGQGESCEYTDPVSIGQVLAVLDTFSLGESHDETDWYYSAGNDFDSDDPLWFVDQAAISGEESRLDNISEAEDYVFKTESESASEETVLDGDENETDVYTVVAEYADGTECRYILTRQQWEELKVLLEDIPAE